MEHWKIKVSNIGPYLRRRCDVIIDDIVRYLQGNKLYGNAGERIYVFL